VRAQLHAPAALVTEEHHQVSIGWGVW